MLKIQWPLPGAVLALFVSSGLSLAAEDTIDYLFVQSAEKASLKEQVLELKGVSETTIYFSDRPDRIAGQMSTEEFIASWTKGDDSFARNHPNAALSVLDGDQAETLIVVLSNPVLKKSKLQYDVKILKGTMPENAAACSLFIDVIGVPRSRASIAGVARRTTRRHVIIGSNIRVAEARAEERDAEEDAEEAKADLEKAKKEAKATEKTAASGAAVKAQHTPEEKLGKLKNLLDEGYISQDDYDKKKAEILDGLN